MVPMTNLLMVPSFIPRLPSSPTITSLNECMILWGKPEQRVPVQNVEQLHAHDHHQMVI